MIFQILSFGCPMVEYEERLVLYAFFNVPNLSKMHWLDGSGWTMAKFIYQQAQQSIKKKITTTQFIAITCDKVTFVDNSS